MVSGLVLDDKTFVALHALENSGLLDSPIADVNPFLLSRFVLLLLGMRRLPPLVPIIRELLKERRFESRGLLDC